MEEELTIDLDFLSVIRTLTHRIWIIFIVAVISAVALDTYLLYTYKPKYQTTSQLLVVSRKNNTYSFYGGIISSEEMTEKFGYLLSSSVMAKEVALNLGYENLPGKIEATVLKDSCILTLTVTADSPINAYNIINNVISSYGNVSKHMDKNAVLEQLDEIRMPMSPCNVINSKKNLVYGFSAGMGASLMIIVLFELLKDDIKTEKQVEKKLDISLFGSLYEERKNMFRLNRKKSILITDIATSFEYIENIKTIRSKLEYYLRNNKQKTVLITSALENEGKSTLAANLALSLGQTGAKVLLVDFDLKKPSQYKIFDLKEKKELSIEDLLIKKIDFNEIIEKNIMGIDILLNYHIINNSELLADSEAVNELINKLSDMYDYIIIDSAPVLVAEDTLALSNKIDVTLLVARQNFARIQYINDAIDLIKDTNGNLIGCVLCRMFRLPFSKMEGYGGYKNYRESHYHRLFKESQKEVEMNHKGDLNE